MTASAVAKLPTLTERINRAHQACENSYRGALEHAFEAGRLLLEAKRGIRHGEWLPWLTKNVTVSERQAQKYMKLAENWQQIEQAETNRGADLADLSLRAALKQIAATPNNNTPPQSTNGHHPTTADEDLDRVELAHASCPDCQARVLHVSFIADPFEWEPLASCEHCQRTRRAHPHKQQVSCPHCGNTGMVGTRRPPGRLLAVDVAWGDEPHARIIGPNTDRRKGEALHRLHQCGQRP